MMNCADVRDRLEACALGFLDADEARECEAHIGFCEACRARQAEVADLVALLGRLSEGTAPSPGLEARILARTAAAPPASRRRVRFGRAAAAAVLAAAALGAIGYQVLAPKPASRDAAPSLAARLDAQQRVLEEVRTEIRELRQADARRVGESRLLARLQREVDQMKPALDEIQSSRRGAENDAALTDKMKAQEDRIKDLEKRLTDTVSQLAALRDQTVNMFLKVASVVSSPLVRY